MAAHLSVVPGHEPGAASPEATKWPWHLTSRDVITVDPRTGQTGEWRVTSQVRDYDTTVVTCELPDGGDRVLVYHGDEKATIRATTAPRPAYTDRHRDNAMQVMNCGDRAYIAEYLRRYHPEIFDEALQRIERRVVAEYTAKETTR